MKHLNFYKRPYLNFKKYIHFYGNIEGADSMFEILNSYSGNKTGLLDIEDLQ